MSALAVNDSLDFNALKKYLDVTDGNLASHIKALEKEEYVGVKKSFMGRKPNKIPVGVHRLAVVRKKIIDIANPQYLFKAFTFKL